MWFFSQKISRLCGNNFTVCESLQSKAEVQRVLYLVSCVPSLMGRQYTSYDYGVETLPATGGLARCDVSQIDFSVNNRK